MRKDRPFRYWLHGCPGRRLGEEREQTKFFQEPIQVPRNLAQKTNDRLAFDGENAEASTTSVTTSGRSGRFRLEQELPGGDHSLPTGRCTLFTAHAEVQVAEKKRASAYAIFEEWDSLMRKEEDRLAATKGKLATLDRAAGIHGRLVWETCTTSDGQKVPFLRIPEVVRDEYGSSTLAIPFVMPETKPKPSPKKP
jgi:hypothetical protein